MRLKKIFFYIIFWCGLKNTDRGDLQEDDNKVSGGNEDLLLGSSNTIMINKVIGIDHDK